jgi:hypothetical protein
MERLNPLTAKHNTARGQPAPNLIAFAVPQHQLFGLQLSSSKNLHQISAPDRLYTMSKAVHVKKTQKTKIELISQLIMSKTSNLVNDGLWDNNVWMRYLVHGGYGVKPETITFSF